MTFTFQQDQFLAQNRISQETWDAALISWDELVQIANNYLSRQAELSKAASFFAQLIQEIKAVHSVRWRVKDVEHLLEKIVRKRAEATQKAEADNKYLGITVENYGAVVTDLIGLRALHLFKDECFEIDASLKGNFQFPEGEEPKAYVREGDAAEFKKRLEDADLRVVLHPAGYRSIHYIVSSQPLKQLITAEIQVRTIFEEGWSEIDHRVRYPNFSDDPQIARFLDIFNNLAGHADEMGSFVRGLVSFQEETKRQQAEAIQSRDDALIKVEELAAELLSARQSNVSRDEIVKNLQTELALLRKAQVKADAAREQMKEGYFGKPSITSRSKAAQILAIASSAISPGLTSAAQIAAAAGIGSYDSNDHIHNTFARNANEVLKPSVSKNKIDDID